MGGSEEPGIPQRGTSHLIVMGLVAGLVQQGTVTDRADGHRCDEIPADGLVQAGPVALAWPLDIAWNGTATAFLPVARGAHRDRSYKHEERDDS